MWPFNNARSTEITAPFADSATPPPLPDQTKNRPMKRHNLARSVSRMYEAGSTDRLTKNWPTTPLSADEIVRRNQRVLVARSREQCANNDYARSFLRMCKQNVVGARGVQLQAQSKTKRGDLDTEANDAIEAAWALWCHCDVTGMQSFRLLQAQALAGAAKDGEFMFLKVYGNDAGPWGFSLQALDPQRCPVDFDVNDNRGGNFIRGGIEYNRYGRPLNYLFTTTSEAETNYRFGGQQYQKIPADQLIHGFMADMVGQKRGLPWMATSLWRAHMLDGFEKAALVNARVSSSKGGFFEWEEGYGPEPNEDEDEEIYMEAEPGSFQELPAGVRFKEWSPQYPSGEFMPFHKSMLRGMASGLGVAYNNLANDLENVNFSSIRQGKLDERDHWKDIQEWLIEQLLQPVFEAWLPHALLSKRIKSKGSPMAAQKIDAFMDVSWQARRWEWIDPRADMAAAEKSKNNFLSSPSQIIREQGRDPQSVWRETARDIETMKAAGIPDHFISLSLGMAQQEPPPESETNTNKGKPDATDD